jgi:hypothetical protein
MITSDTAVSINVKPRSADRLAFIREHLGFDLSIKFISGSDQLLTVTDTCRVVPQVGLAEIFTVKLPRFPAPLLAPTVMTAVPFPTKLVGTTVRVKGFPLPAVVALIV